MTLCLKHLSKQRLVEPCWPAGWGGLVAEVEGMEGEKGNCGWAREGESVWHLRQGPDSSILQALCPRAAESGRQAALAELGGANGREQSRVCCPEAILSPAYKSNHTVEVHVLQLASSVAVVI